MVIAIERDRTMTTYIIRRAHNRSGKLSFFSRSDKWAKQSDAREFPTRTEAVHFLAYHIPLKISLSCAVLETE
jgi:hypothetical protein